MLCMKFILNYFKAYFYLYNIKDDMILKHIYNRCDKNCIKMNYLLKKREYFVMIKNYKTVLETDH